jgi:hypothetical protein
MSQPSECSCGHGWGMHNEYGCYEKVGSASCDDAYCFCGVVPPKLKAELKESKRLSLLKSCKTHPKYQIKAKPRSTCEECWRMWVTLNDDNSRNRSST